MCAVDTGCVDMSRNLELFKINVYMVLRVHKNNFLWLRSMCCVLNTIVKLSFTFLKPNEVR